MSNPGEMELVVDAIRSGNMSANLNVNPHTAKGGSHTGSNLGKTGAGAGIGAVIGAIAGGGKGAAIGAGAGGAVGAGTAAATGKKPAKIDAEAVIQFVLATDAQVTFLQTGNTRNVPADAPDLTGDAGPRRGDGPNLGRRPAREEPNGAERDNNQSFNSQTVSDIQNCFNTRADEIPASFIRKDRNAPPNGYARGDLLSAEDMDRARMMPDVCAGAVPKLSSSRMIVVLNAQVMLLNSAHRVLDVFSVQ